MAEEFITVEYRKNGEKLGRTAVYEIKAGHAFNIGAYVAVREPDGFARARGTGCEKDNGGFVRIRGSGERGD